MGKNLVDKLKNFGTSLAVAGSLVASSAQGAIKDITSHSAIISRADMPAPPKPLGRTVNYIFDNISQNGHAPNYKTVGIYMKWEPAFTVPAYVLAGGFTSEAGQSSTTNAYFNARTTGWRGLDHGQVATNGLNGTSFWHIAQDTNGDGNVGTFNTTTGVFTWDAGEYLGTDPNLNNNVQINLLGVPEFPASGSGPVHVDRLDIKGYTDQDHDVLPDYWENQHGTNLVPSQDNDGDGKTNWEEFLFDTNPISTNSVPSGLNLSTTQEGISFPTRTDRQYFVEKCNNLPLGNWAPVTNFWGNGQTYTFPFNPSETNCNVRAYILGPND